MNLITVDDFRKEVRAKRTPSGGVFRVSTYEPKALADGSRTIRFCFSDGSVDRMGDTIEPSGWDLTDFNRNPVSLWAHDASQPPIGRASNVGIEGARLMGDIEFADVSTYAFADTIYRLTLGKFLNAVSVGFIPTDYQWSKEDDREWGIDFLKQLLLEISLCPIPANPNALGEARAKGIDTRPLALWAEQALDAAGKIMIPKKELERLRKAAKEPPMARRAAPPPRRRSSDDDDDEPKSCGLKATETCGFEDPNECSIHAKTKADDDDRDDDKKSLLFAQRVMKHLRALQKSDADRADAEPPLAHEDAIRMAHKSLRTAKSYQTDAMMHYRKAMDHLDGVMDALDGSSDSGDADGDNEPKDKPDEDDPEAEKSSRIRRAAERRKRLTAV